MTEPCNICALVHAPEKFRCLYCGATFQCEIQFFSTFGPRAHRRTNTVLVFDAEGNGPWPEPRDELLCGPIAETPVAA